MGMELGSHSCLTYPPYCASCSRDGQPGDLSSASYPPLISQPPQTFSKSMYHPLSPLPGDHGFSKKSGCSHIAERDAFWFAFGSNDWAVTSQALLYSCGAPHVPQLLAMCSSGEGTAIGLGGGSPFNPSWKEGNKSIP